MNTKHLMEGAKGQGLTEKRRKQRKAIEFLWNKICRGQEDIASDHSEHCEGDSEESDKDKEDISFRTKQDHVIKVKCKKIMRKNKRLVRELNKAEVKLEVTRNTKS